MLAQRQKKILNNTFSCKGENEQICKASEKENVFGENLTGVPAVWHFYHNPLIKIFEEKFFYNFTKYR